MALVPSEASQHVHGDYGDTDEVSNSGSRGKRKASQVWAHFTKVRLANNIIKAKCNHCDKLLSGQGGTNHLWTHIKNACPKFKFEDNLVGSPRNEFIFDQLESRKEWAIACIKHNYPFNMCDHAYYKKFLGGLNPNFKLPCRNTLRGDILDIYGEQKVKAYKVLDALNCKVSLTTDLWKSRHSHTAYYALTAHYIDENWSLHKRILAFRDLPCPHDGETLFTFTKELILEWNLERKIITVVVDNAKANDVMIRKLKEWLVRDSLIDFDGDLLHVRCSAHILNLIVQDGLDQIRDMLEKVRETVRYLNGSIPASQKFETALKECNLGDKRKIAMDVSNRWNSTYDMLATALPLKEAFNRLQRIDKNYKFNPSELEWEVATVVHSCLELFYQATRHFSGRKYPTSNVFFQDVCEIKLRMTEWEYSEKDYIRSMSGPMLTKFEKYWDECSLVLAVAVVFDPRFKMDLVEYFYTKIYALNAHSYVQRVRDILVRLFVEYGGNLFPSVSDSLYDSSCGGSATLRDFDRWYEESRSMVNQKSELDSYLEEPRFPRVDTFNILDWWRTNSPKLPTLAKIARDILAVPATTVASEAAFSVGGRVIDEHRSCLLPDVVQGLIVADDWIDSLEHLAI